MAMKKAQVLACLLLLLLLLLVLVLLLLLLLDDTTVGTNECKRRTINSGEERRESASV
jgi:NADH:ubiquinone oxidoreductase subunit 3 (subunit A)